MHRTDMFPELPTNAQWRSYINHDFFFSIYILYIIFHNSFPTNFTLNLLSLKTKSHVAHAARLRLLYAILFYLYVQFFFDLIPTVIAFSKITLKIVAYGKPACYSCSVQFSSPSLSAPRHWYM